jgi:signal transduction histidine kinase
LGDIARDASERMRPLAEERRLRLVCTCAPAPLNGDPNGLQQVAMNLLQNAVRYNRDGGEIRVTTKSDDTHAVLMVSDDGIGIGPDDLRHVFERFYRADKARSRAQGGTGLGLSISKAIVDAHGGTIAAESQLGKGTTFTVRIPR